MEKLENIRLNVVPGEIIAKVPAKQRVEQNWIQGLLDMVGPLITAKAVFRVCQVDEKHREGVTINGFRLKSRVLHKCLDHSEIVFPFVVTIGVGLEEKCNLRENMLEKFYIDMIGNIALVKARMHLEDHLRGKYALNTMSYMSPGSLEDWPIEEQSPLFSILSGVEECIGVGLSENFLMIPKKSVSGIYFPTETEFYSCQLCTKDRCPGRQAGYSKEMAREYGIL